MPTEDAPIPDLTPEQIAALNALARVAGNLHSLQQRKNGWGGRRPGAGAPKGNLNALKHGRTSRQVQDFIEAVGANPTTRETLAAIARRQRRQRRDAEKVAALLISGMLGRVLASLENNENEEEIARLRAVLAAFVDEKISGNQSPPPYKSRKHSRRASQLTDAFFDQFGL